MPSNWINAQRLMPLSVWVGSPTSLNTAQSQGSFAGGSSTIGASNVMLYPVAVTEPYRVRRLWWLNGTSVAGNVDVAIYDAAGVQLISTGSTVQSGTNNIQSVAVDYTLGIGSYWLGLATSSTGTFQSFLTQANTIRQRDSFGIAQHFTVGSAIPLPTQLVFGSNLCYAFPYFGFSRLTSI